MRVAEGTLVMIMKCRRNCRGGGKIMKQSCVCEVEERDGLDIQLGMPPSPNAMQCPSSEYLCTASYGYPFHITNLLSSHQVCFLREHSF